MQLAKHLNEHHPTLTLNFTGSFAYTSIVGNAEYAAVLECTLTGPALRFMGDTLIALGGAEMTATLDGQPVTYWKAVEVKAGQVLALGRVKGPGMRTYLGVYG